MCKNIFSIRHNECYLSFRLDFAPNYVFCGVYIQPENAKYFQSKMFADVNSLLHGYRQNGFVPFIGGDFNSRLGDLNKLGSGM